MRDRLISIKVVLDRAGIGRTKMRELMARGEFPQVVHVGTSARWSEVEIEDWIRRQLDAREPRA